MRGLQRKGVALLPYIPAAPVQTWSHDDALIAACLLFIIGMCNALNALAAPVLLQLPDWPGCPTCQAAAE